MFITIKLTKIITLKFNKKIKKKINKEEYKNLMSILYVVISRSNNTILADHSLCYGDHE